MELLWHRCGITQNNRASVGLDWKDFDIRTQGWEITDAATIVKDMIDFTQITTPDGIHHISPEKGKRYERIFDWVIDNFINSKIMLPDGTTY